MCVDNQRRLDRPCIDFVQFGNYLEFLITRLVLRGTPYVVWFSHHENTFFQGLSSEAAGFDNSFSYRLALSQWN